MYKTKYSISLPKFNIFITNQRTPSLYYIPYVRTNYGKNSLFYQGPKIWNAINNEVKNLTSINIFKKTILNQILETY
jgi:hypothetical protein